ncbi:hypothetical protein RUM44_001293 [Polyplax serrata]|uniref:Uncharacterized protein n=1 Tax=Polyplax serrata TaxID=468196 RepID=A0ABR1AJN9_POLSC
MIALTEVDRRPKAGNRVGLKLGFCLIEEDMKRDQGCRVLDFCRKRSLEMFRYDPRVCPETGIE